MVKPPPVEFLRHAQFERCPPRIPLREAIGVHVDEPVVRRRARPLSVSDQALAIEPAVDPQRRRDVEMHFVGVKQGDAARLPQHPLNRIVGEGGFELGQDFKWRHTTKAAAELRDDVEIVFVVGASRRDRGVDRHGTLRIEVLDLVEEGGSGLEMAPHCFIARLRLVMQ